MTRFKTRIRILVGVLAVAFSIGTTTFAAITPASAATVGTTRAYAAVVVTGPSSARVTWSCHTWGWRPSGTIKIHCKMYWGGTLLSNLSRTCSNTTWCYLPASGSYSETVPLIPNGLKVVATGTGPAGTSSNTAYGSL